jgi:hypothetical protein
MSAKLRKSASAIPAYRGASMPSKFLYLYLQTLPRPAGGVMRLSFGQLMEELSMPARWLKNAMAEMSANGLIQACGNMVFVPRGVERIDNPNMVTSALRKLERLDAQDGPIPAPIWQHLLQTVDALLEEKPYLSALREYAAEKAQSAPESVAQWDAGAAWMQDAEWGMEDRKGTDSSDTIFSSRETSLIQAIVQSTLTSAIPAILQPMISLLRTGGVTAPAAGESAANPLQGVGDPSPTDHANTVADPFAADVDAAMERIGGLHKSNPVAYLFPVRRDEYGEQHKVFTNHVHNMHRDLGDLLDIDSEMGQMLAWLEAHPEKIPARDRANEYIWNWMRRKRRQVMARQACSQQATTQPLKDEADPETSAEAAPLQGSGDHRPQDNANVSTLQDSAQQDLFDAPKTDASSTATVEQHVSEPSTAMATVTAEQPPQQKSDTPEGFDAFWAAYPRHDAKINAIKAFRKHVNIKVLQQILDDIQYRKERVWHEPQYIPMPATYLNQHRWEDERTVNTGAFKGSVIKGVVVQQQSEEERREEFLRLRREEKAREQRARDEANGNCVDLSSEDWKVAS